MYQLTNIDVTGFWDKSVISVQLHPDVNIFIGKNGTGKTTFINILFAILKCDIESIIELPFEKIVLKLSTTNKKAKYKTRTISVVKNFNNEFLTFKIGNKSFDLPFGLARRHDFIRYESEFPPFRAHRIYRDLLTEFRELTKISLLSIQRGVFGPEDEIMHRKSLNTVDQKLEKLVDDLATYLLMLQNEAAIVSKSFQDKVLLTMLYDPDLDNLDINECLEIDIDSVDEGLRLAYDSLQINNKRAMERINKHIKTLKSNISAIKKINKESNKNGITIPLQTVGALPLVKRGKYIQKLAQTTESKKNQILEPRNRFLLIANEFISQLTLEFDDDYRLLARKGDHIFDLEKLSSGEKQLLIFLIETMLQKEESFIFIADEPELSLHIDWQAKLLPTITKLNPNAQIIVATHSPELAGSNPTKLIDMEDIIHVHP